MSEPPILDYLSPQPVTPYVRVRRKPSICGMISLLMPTAIALVWGGLVAYVYLRWNIYQMDRLHERIVRSYGLLTWFMVLHVIGVGTGMVATRWTDRDQTSANAGMVLNILGTLAMFLLRGT